MRIAHVTDIHVMVPPKLSQLFGKRLLGAVNLFLMGRESHFSEAVQVALADALREANLDAIICTGDISAMATPEEFNKFEELFGEVFDSHKTSLVTGNHDTYAYLADRNKTMERQFGKYMGSGKYPRVHDLNEKISVVTIDSSRFHILSSGKVARDELERLDQLLAGMGTRGIFISLHYPLRGRDGSPYGPSTRNLSNARALEAVLTKHANRIVAILHGHEHHGFRTALGGGVRDIPIINPGASGYAWLPDHNRTAHFNIYTVDESDNPLEISVERFRYCGDDKSFITEVGGAYSTGR